jgi:transposase
MKSYSLDLRQKLLSAHARRLGSQRALADLFGVSLSFVEKLLARQRRTGEIAPKPHRGGPARRLDATAEGLLRRWVQEQPDRTLAELGDRLAAAIGQRVSLPTLCRVLQRLGLPRKKSHSMRRSATGRR